MPDQPRPTPLAFHKLIERFSYGATNFAPKRFFRLLERLQQDGWELAAGEGQKSILLTFDDAYQHLLDILPEVIERFKCRPLVFVPTGLIGRPNRWDYSHWLRPTEHLNRASIKRLADLGVRFGSHGHSHGDLTSFDDSRLGAELLISRATLEDLVGRKVTAISYPFGRCDQRVRNAAQAAGYEEGYTMRFPDDTDDTLALGRVAVYGYDTPLTVSMKLGDGFPARVEALKARVTNRLSGGTVLLNRLRRVRSD